MVPRATAAARVRLRSSAVLGETGNGWTCNRKLAPQHGRFLGSVSQELCCFNDL